MMKFGLLLATLLSVGCSCGAAFGATSPDINQAGTLIDEGDHAVAVERLSDIIREEQVTPQDMAEAYFLRGTAQQSLGLLGHSVADYTKAIWLMGESSEQLADAHFHRGQVYSALRQLKRAIGDFDRAIELRSNFARAYAARGDAYRDRGVHRLAIDDYGASIRYLNPDLHLPFYGRGLTYETMGRTQQAMADFRRSYELAPDFMPAREKLFDQTPTGSIEGPDALLADTGTNSEGEGQPTLIADATQPLSDTSAPNESEALPTEADGSGADSQETEQAPALRPSLVELPQNDATQNGAVAEVSGPQEADEEIAAEETPEPSEPSPTATSASLIAPDKVLVEDSGAPQTSDAVNDEQPKVEVGSVDEADKLPVSATPDPVTTADTAAAEPSRSTEVEQVSAPNVDVPAPDVANDVAIDAETGVPEISVPENTVDAAKVETPAVPPASTVETSDAVKNPAVAPGAQAQTGIGSEPASVEQIPDAPADATNVAAVQTPTSPENTTPAGTAGPVSVPQAAAEVVRKTGFFVQIASYRDEGEASVAFDRIAARHSEVLSGAGSDIARADLGSKGVYYRLRVGPYDTIGSSSTVCSKLKARNQDCLVIEEK